MRSNTLKSRLIKSGLAASVLLLASGAAFAQQQINLTAGPTTATMPDGSAVPMWGYSCGTAVTGSVATCAALNPAATTPATWSPVVITVPAGASLQINLTNSLTFGANSVPTSLVIVGQVGGGLGAAPTRDASPSHANAQYLTWPIADPTTTNTPPAQSDRVRSFATEVAAGPTAVALTWNNLRPGTYLIESGTHPSIQGPMGLYGVLVVTTAPAGGTAGTAYPGVTYNAEVALLMSEIDPVQNGAVATAVTTTGFTETAVWSGLPGGCGNPASATYHTCYPPAVNYTPLYYLINGVAFSKNAPINSQFAAVQGTNTATIAGTVLVRLVNAGLRMHVPAIVGALTGTAGIPGLSLIAEDGNVLPGVPRVQNEVFMPAGKTNDVLVNVPTGTAALPIFDRELSLSSNATSRDSGMLAYISVNGGTTPTATAAVARNDAYTVLLPCAATPCPGVTVSDPSHGLIANDTNVFGVTLLTAPTQGTVTLNRDGTFSYVPSATGVTPDSFTYCANGAVTGTVCASGISATVNLTAATVEAAGGIVLGNAAYTANSLSLAINPPGILAFDTDTAGYPLTVNAASVAPGAGLTLSVDANGGFHASAAAAGTFSFTYKAQNSQGTVSSGTATVSITFPAPSGLVVNVIDGTDKVTAIGDYRWIIEEDRTFYIDPACTANPPPAGCPGATGILPTFGTNFHTSYMPVIATGCTGTLSCEGGQSIAGVPVVCDVGNGVCRTTGTQQTAVLPGTVHLDPNKHYYLSVLPGDAANPFIDANLTANCSHGQATANTQGDTLRCGHGMGGAPITPTCTISTTGVRSCVLPTSITVLTQPAPYPPAQLSVFVYEDDFPLNGENDSGGGVADTLSQVEPGLGGFNITLFDDAGGTGDATGQMTYDMFNQPLVNGLAGYIDPSTGHNACPISQNARSGANDPTQTGITGTIVTCPKFEDDGVTLSPLAGQAIVPNLMVGRYGVVATPGADRIARGEEWLQTNTLDGQKAHDSFLRIGEPSYFQEFGPAGFHVSIGFANPAIINSRLAGVCNGTDLTITGTNCTNSVTGVVTTERMSRTPDERLYSSGDNSSFAFTQCYVSFGDPDGEDFAFTKCAADGSFTLSGLPDGSWRVTVFDQWNDMLVDGLSTPVLLGHGATTDLGQIATNQWQANIYTQTFIDSNKNGVRDTGEAGLTLAPTNIRFRDGSYSNFNNTDLAGNAGFNEVFPLFSWYVVETDSTRFKNTGIHVVYDAGGPADGSGPCGLTGNAPCGTATGYQFMANTAEQVSVPNALRVPGAVYCANADCPGKSLPGGVGSSTSDAVCTTQTNGQTTCTTALSTGRIDPPWVLSEGWQGFSGQNSFLDFGKTPYVPGENGGIRGEVIYASTRPFDDPQLLIHTSWTPDVPGVTVNLYQVGTGADGTQTLKLVDTTVTSSWDNWAQGFRSDGVPNMNCPGQGRDTGTEADLFFFTLFNQPMYLDLYNNGGTPTKTIPNNSQFKCYDGMHNWNQLQPAPYDGMYQFPSVTGLNPTTGAPLGTNCTICVANPDTTDAYRSGTPMLPRGQYVVEMIVPPGYELVKEEDKNILIGDNYIAPVTQEFPGLAGAVYILPDQAAVGATFNANNPQNATRDMGRLLGRSSHEGDTGSVESFWPCVGASRIVPDYISLFPQSHEVAPFAGATRNLCDRKLVNLDDQTSVLAKFWIFTSTHVAAHFTGVITDDFTSEFDPFSPQFGEKFSPANLPIAIKDWTGSEITRIYSDHWGTYNGLTYSTWEVNPPNPTGYGPTMMVTCMNDPGTGATPDPLFNPAYSQFCYEIPFMPGQTQYMDTPVVPTSAFAGAGYNNPDCAYPDATPAIKTVVSNEVAGPWVSAAGAGHTLTITALGDTMVNNNGYSGPSATVAPYDQKTVSRHYGFGTAAGTVTIGGINAPVSGAWGDLQLTVTVPTGVAPCPVQQQRQYGAPAAAAQCGELVITAANGKSSIDAINVTIGGKHPSVLAAGTTIQSALDGAMPGDMIIVPPGSYSELLIMWKPVRLQGVGAASSIINANTHPAGKLDPWRRQLSCMFGMALDGVPATPAHPYDPTGTYSCGTSANFGAGPTTLQNFVGRPDSPQIDRLPLEATVGWDVTLNGNLAELLQEPTLMGALSGAGITVLSKGVHFPPGSNPFAADVFPVGTLLLTNSTSTTRGCGANTTTSVNPYPSSFWCNPSAIDGLGITNSSQGGGGVLVHAWGHNIQIANNRVANNTGTLSGGINIGQGEFPGAYLGGAAAINADPGSCQSSGVTNLQLPYCFDMNVNVHHNAVSLNSSTGDELFSATPAGAGGVSFCTGADFYKFNFNWVCGNLSTGDGGGLGHLGFIYNGDIERNTFLFNQSTNPTIAANGGGMVIMGAPDVDPPCSTFDQDCVGATNLIGPSDGTGPGLVINANLVLGNAAESGAGGGIMLQNVNGSDVVSFPTSPTRWNSVTVTNNIIANNVAGWDGGGIGLLDALNVNIINNTIMSNDTTASSGVLFNTIGAPLASTQGCPPPLQIDPNTGLCSGSVITSTGQPAGLVSIRNSAVLMANLPATISCPAGHFGTASATNGSCRTISFPELYNNIFWQNRAFDIGVGALGGGTLNQQNVVALYNALTTPLNSTPAVSQATTDARAANGNGSIITGGTGACPTPVSYWDIGVRGDTGPSNHVTISGNQFKLAPTYSVLTDAADYAGLNNTGLNPTVVSQYCNGSRTPPEFKSLGYQVPPGISDATVPNPVFSLTPAATVDEGNNWINISWGPLTLTNVSNQSGNGTLLGNYAPAAGSPAINYIPSTATAFYNAAPPTDFFGRARKTGGNPVDAGAVEFAAGAGTPAAADLTGGPLAFGNQVVTTTSAAQTLTLQNTGGATLTGIAIAVTGPFARSGGTCGATLTVAAGSCTIGIVFSPTVVGAAVGTVAVTVTNAGVVVTGSPTGLSGTGIAIVRTATVTPNPLAFGNWATGTASNPVLATVTNTGNIALAGGTFTTSGAPFTRSGGTCAAGLAVGATCTVGVVFAPTATVTSNGSLTVAYTGATVTPTPLPLSGTGVAARSSVSIVPNPLRITIGGITGTGTVTLTNTGAAGASSVAVTNVTVPIGGSLLTYFFNINTNTCTGVNLAPGASCTVNVRFTNIFAPRGVDRADTITFTDTATASPQVGALIGHAN